MPRLYQAWPARNRFLPFGCIMGPLSDTCANIYVYLCIIGVLIPYFIFLFKDIWNITPAVPILFFISALITIFFLNLTQCTDPGIVPRRPFLETEPQKYLEYLEQLPTENEAPRRFCQTCKIYRPPRTSHCSTCDNCIQVFDHHCPFVNNCIGKRNYRFFICFLVSVMLTCVLFVVNLVIYFISRSGEAVNSIVIIVICAVIVGVVAIPLLGFLIFHLYLIVTGKTTRQVIKEINEEKHKNQWCKVDPPLIDYFQKISQQSLAKLIFEINNLHLRPDTQVKIRREQPISDDLE